jgi:hypothetical protein
MESRTLPDCCRSLLASTEAASYDVGSRRNLDRTQGLTGETAACSRCTL